MRIIDLTVELQHGFVWPKGIPLYVRNPTRIEVIGAMGRDDLESLRTAGVPIAPDVEAEYVAVASRLVMTTHTGTHVDVPRHFLSGGSTMADLPLERLVGDAVVLDVSHRGTDELVIADDLERAKGDLRPGEIALIRTGWIERMWSAPDFPKGMPALGPDAGRWLVDQRVSVVAMDCRTDSYGSWGHFTNHVALLGAGIILVEVLTNLSHIRKRRVKFIGLPLKIRSVDGAPARVIALED